MDKFDALSVFSTLFLFLRWFMAARRARALERRVARLERQAAETDAYLTSRRPFSTRGLAS